MHGPVWKPAVKISVIKVLETSLGWHARSCLKTCNENFSNESVGQLVLIIIYVSIAQSGMPFIATFNSYARCNNHFHVCPVHYSFAQLTSWKPDIEQNAESYQNTNSGSANLFLKGEHFLGAQTFSWSANIFLKHKHFLEVQTFSWGANLFLKHKHFLEAQTFSWSANIFLRCYPFLEAWAFSGSANIFFKCKQFFACVAYAGSNLYGDLFFFRFQQVYWGLSLPFHPTRCINDINKELHTRYFRF